MVLHALGNETILLVVQEEVCVGVGYWHCFRRGKVMQQCTGVAMRLTGGEKGGGSGLAGGPVQRQETLTL